MLRMCHHHKFASVGVITYYYKNYNDVEMFFGTTDVYFSRRLKNSLFTFSNCGMKDI